LTHRRSQGKINSQGGKLLPADWNLKVKASTK
jgi:hypothetical protein